jgi:hypothetical protein
VSLDEIPVAVLNKLFFFSFLIIFIFIILTFVNQGYKSVLIRQKEEQTELISSLQRMESKQNLVIGIDRKIKFYQQYSQSRKSLFDKSEFIFDHVDPNIIVNNGAVEGKGFIISLKGKNVYLFTQLIMQYLEGNKVSEVSIISANYDSDSKEFSVDLKGVFK